MTEQTEPQTETSDRPGLFAELKRRKVFRVIVTYTVVGWLVIQVAETTFPSLGIPDWAMRLVIMAVLLGFPLAIVLAWAFELTPQGLMTAREAARRGAQDAAPESHERTRNRFAILGAAFLPAAIFAALALYFYLRLPADMAEPAAVASSTVATDNAGNQRVILRDNRSIAVLPFENRSDHNEDQYFVDGMHDDLLTQISRIRDIKTISRTSVMAYRGTTKNMRTIGEELDVTTILEGGIQRAGRQIRVNMQLIDAATDAHLWAETYTRELSAENVFQVQSEIARSVAGALQAVLSLEDQQRMDRLPTRNLAALEAYFRGLAAGTNDGDALARAEEHFREAADLDPEFADVHLWLAGILMLQIYYNGLPIEQQIGRAMPLLDRAVTLQGETSLSHVVRAYIHRYRGDLPAAEASLKAAIVLNPNDAVAFQTYGNVLNWGLARPGEAAVMFEKAYALNPQNWGTRQELAEALMLDMRFDEAKAMLERLIDEDATRVQPHRSLMTLNSWFLARYDEAVRAGREAYALDPSNPNIAFPLFEAYAGLDDTAGEAFWVQRAIDVAPNGPMVPLLQAIRVLAENGDAREALRLVEQVESGSDQYGNAVAMKYRLLLQLDGPGAAGQWIVQQPWFVDDIDGDLDWRSRFQVPTSVEALVLLDEGDRAYRLAEKTLSRLSAFPPIVALEVKADIYLALDDTDRTAQAVADWLAVGGCIGPARFLAWKETDVRFSPVRRLLEQCSAVQRQRLATWEADGKLAPIPPLTER